MNENGLRTTSYVYDPLGNVTSVTQTPAPGTAPSVTSSFTYQQPFNELTTVTDPLNHTTKIAYDASGSVQSITDPLNRVTGEMHNSAGQLTSITNPLGQTTSYSYDNGLLQYVTNPSGQTTIYSYNGQTVEVQPPSGGSTDYNYDGFG
ncbi:MAG: hypothetical protein ACREQ4_03465, partial [Candidatus Binataceae bacterium]